MNTYKIQITETLQRVIEVDANDECDAINIVCEKYQTGKIVLDYNDFIDYDIELYDE